MNMYMRSSLDTRFDCLVRKKWPQIPVGIYESKAEGKRVSRRQRFARLLRGSRGTASAWKVEISSLVLSLLRALADR